MKQLTDNQILILANLARAKRFLSIKRISERVGLHWKTTKINLLVLEKRKLIDVVRSSRRTYSRISKWFAKNNGDVKK